MYEAILILIKYAGLGGLIMFLALTLIEFLNDEDG